MTQENTIKITNGTNIYTNIKKLLIRIEIRRKLFNKCDTEFDELREVENTEYVKVNDMIKLIEETKKDIQMSLDTPYNDSLPTDFCDENLDKIIYILENKKGEKKMKETDWTCELCGKRKLEAIFRMWIKNKEIRCCYFCRGNQIMNTKANTEG